MKININQNKMNKQLIADIQARIKEAEDMDALIAIMSGLFKEIDLEEYTKEISDI
jgi:N-methylhydantoinase B/oxoprolinase/acetone carboxylase alpha subunit